MALNTAQQLQESLGVAPKIGSGDNWDEIRDKLEARAIQVIAETSSACNEMAQTVIQAGMSNKDFITQAQGTMRDIGHYRDRFLALQRQRGDRTGPTKDGADYTDYARIGMEHLSMHQEMAVVVGQGLIALSGFHEEARQRLQAADVMQVTDVEARDIPAQAETQEQAKA